MFDESALAKRDEYSNERFTMKRRQRRSKEIKNADSRDFPGIMRKIWSMEMTRIEHCLIFSAEFLVTWKE